MNIATMTRADLECAILEYEILPCNTAAELAALAAMSTEELRAAVHAWIVEGDETAVAS